MYSTYQQTQALFNIWQELDKSQLYKFKRNIIKYIVLTNKNIECMNIYTSIE
jgi:hypothetical protein